MKPSIDKTSEQAAAEKKDASDAPMTAREEWTEFLKTGMIALLLAFVIRTLFLEPFNIPSGSMRPTLEIGDYLFVSKPAYGYSRHSFPFGMAPIEGRVGPGELPQRGDVVVFKLPSNEHIDYIKRIVALPGETVQVTDGILYINRRRVPREQVDILRIKEAGQSVTVTEYIETLPGGVTHSIYEESDNKPLDNTPEYVVPEGHYFLMGDNRDNSQDSRVLNLVGYVPLENIVGKASFIFFSTNGHAGLVEFWKWPWTIRYNRVFQGISPEKTDS